MTIERRKERLRMAHCAFNLAASALLVFHLAESGYARDATAQRTVSPFSVARSINENKAERGKRRDAPVMDFGRLWEMLGIEAGAFEKCSGECGAEIFRHELDGEPGREVLLKLNKSSDVFRYLIFKRANAPRDESARWGLLGFVDHDFNRYETSRHRVARAGGKSWLVIRGQEGSGTGYALYGETWYAVGAKGVRPALHYYAEGQVYPWPKGLGRKFKGRVLAPRPGNDVSRVTVQYDVAYQALDYRLDKFAPLATNRLRLAYRWNARAGAFLYDPRRSDVSEEVIALIADVEPAVSGARRTGGTTFHSGAKDSAEGGCEWFLKYNLGPLRRAAAGRNGWRKEWLREFLAGCGDTPEKAALLRALRD